MKKISIILSALLFIWGCQPAAQQTSSEDHQHAEAPRLPARAGFQTSQEGGATDLYYLSHPAGIAAAVSNFGGTLISLWVKDKAGTWTDVVLGFNSLAEYQEHGGFYGATIGRYGNRIQGGQFSLEDQTYTLPQNNGPNTLHGGPGGFHAVAWQATQVDEKTLELSHSSPDGTMGFPGRLRVKITYTLTGDRGLRIDYEATTDAPTVLNLTNHAYFNLNGEGRGTITQHSLEIAASRITPVDSTLIPTGELTEVEGTPFDFRQATLIGTRIEAEHQQMIYGNGYDHNFVLDAGMTLNLHPAAVATGDKSGISMEILTREPGVQFYTGNFMNGSFGGKSGQVYGRRHAFCLETQHFPDSPNQPAFPSTRLLPGELYQTSTLYRFSIQPD